MLLGGEKFRWVDSLSGSADSVAMDDLTPKEIQLVGELQNQMVLEGFDVSWDRCIKARAQGAAELKAEEALPDRKMSQLIPPRR
jgi:hypothetical protein